MHGQTDRRQVLTLLSDKVTRINSTFQPIHFTVLYFTRVTEHAHLTQRY